MILKDQVIEFRSSVINLIYIPILGMLLFLIGGGITIAAITAEGGLILMTLVIGLLMMSAGVLTTMGMWGDFWRKLGDLVRKIKKPSD